VNTLEEVKEWDGVNYTSVMGFKRAFNSHEVYVDADSGRYIFTCAEDQDTPPFVTGDFTSFDAVIHDVASFYTKAWKLPSTEC
jgi:hypothetical protein